MIEAHRVEDDGATVKLEARREGLLLARVEVELVAPAAAAPGVPDAPAEPFPRAPTFVALERLAGLKGQLPLALDRARAAAMLPALSAALAPAELAEVLALTRLVGMVAPGARSIFSGLQVRRRASAGDVAALDFGVSRVVPAFSVVKLAVSGPALEGNLDTLYRPMPEAQPRAETLRERVAPGRFEGQVALVVGGSRGLGEVTAKLVALGGGLALVTYHHGREDAERVVDDIRAAGGRAEALRLDVLAPAEAIAGLAARGVRPTHVYYFASPRIGSTKAAAFVPELFRGFVAYYVEGLAATWAALRAHHDGPLALLVPSTVFLDERPRDFEEYVAAKAAAEALAAGLAARDPALRVLVERLPRTATDQTVSLIRARTRSAVDVMLPLVERLASQG